MLKFTIAAAFGVVVLLAADPEVPVPQSPYVRVYRPGGDVFQGPGTRAKAGVFYEYWIPNDHTFAKSLIDGRWHLFGITRPSDSPAIPKTDVHADEVQSLHAVSPASSFRASMRTDSWRDLPKVLGPMERPGEPPAFYAPHVISRQDLYHMFWGPGSIWHGTSADLARWEPKGAAFAETDLARDPNVQFFNGTYYLYYCKGKGVSVRTSTDLAHWSNTPSELVRLTQGSMESPFVIFHKGYYYLFWTIYDGTNTAYDWRTYVVRSRTPTGFASGQKLGLILAHAPEWIQAEGGESYVSTVEWPTRGISVASVKWETGNRFPVAYHSIPGAIDMVNYDNGGEGVAYHCGRPPRGGHPYRPEESVDIARCGESSYDVRGLRASDWLEYTVVVQQTRNYSVEVTLGADPGQGTFHLEWNGRASITSIRIPANARAHQVITLSNLPLRAGRQRLRVMMESSTGAAASLHSIAFR